MASVSDVVPDHRTPTPSLTTTADPELIWLRLVNQNAGTGQHFYKLLIPSESIIPPSSFKKKIGKPTQATVDGHPAASPNSSTSKSARTPILHLSKVLQEDFGRRVTYSTLEGYVVKRAEWEEEEVEALIEEGRKYVEMVALQGSLIPYFCGLYRLKRDHVSTNLYLDELGSDEEGPQPVILVMEDVGPSLEVETGLYEWEGMDVNLRLEVYQLLSFLAKLGYQQANIRPANFCRNPDGRLVAVDIDSVYKISAEDRIRARNIAYIFLFISIDSESEEEEEEKAGVEEVQRGWNHWRSWICN